jgi:predicted DNA-binding transcriptional regulator YafY
MMLLQARGRMTAPTLAATLEVSTRTILRDIDALSAAGVPIWSDRGRDGGFQLREGWSTALTGMTEPEVNALFLAGLPGPATELGLGNAAVSARLKIVASLPPDWRAQADRVTSRLHIDALAWYQTQETPQFLRETADAVWRGHRIEIRYDSWLGVAERELEPLGLVLKAGIWYLIAQQVAKKDALTFRLSNIQAFKSTARTFKRPLRFDLSTYWQESTATFERELYRFTAHIAVSPRGQKWFANAQTKVTRVTAQSGTKNAPANWQEFLMPIESIEHGARQLLAHGAHVKVIGPEALKNRIANELRALNALYAESPVSPTHNG